MRRIKQSIHLGDESLKKLYEREQQIKLTESDLSHIQRKIERGKLQKLKGKRKPFRPSKTREPINEDCLNISVDGVHHQQLNNFSSNGLPIGGGMSVIQQDQSYFGLNDRESSINLDLIRTEMEPIDDGASSIKSKKTSKMHKALVAKGSSRLSGDSQSSNRKAATGAPAPAKKKLPKTASNANMSDTASVRSTKTKGGSKKKKKGTDSRRDEGSVDGDT